MMVLEHPGFEFEHQQEHDPCGGIDGSRVGLEEVARRNAVRILEPRCQDLLAEEQEDIDRQQGIDRVLERLVQDFAVDFQTVAPAARRPILCRA
jgi:hypothetical protein